MAESFDLVVIGTGAGASAPATKCRRAGWRVAVVDELPYGGTCALRGCDPKKVLVGAAEAVDWHRRMNGLGLEGAAQITWPELIRFKRTFTDPVPASREAVLDAAGITAYHDAARFIGEDRIAVGDVVLEARHVVLATGARPRPLGIPGEEHVRTSTDFLELEQLPPRIVFIGAGYISFEFAHVAQRAGAQAIIIGRGAPLAQFDQDLVRHLVAHTRSLGVEVRLDAAVTAVERHDSRYRVSLVTPTGQESVEVDLVVHGAGRVPNTTGLDLATGHVAIDALGGVQVNGYLQSVSNPRVYAAGDAVQPPGSMPLTPVAGYDGVTVAANLLHGNVRSPDYRGIPSVVFTIPPLARVGLTEADARREQLDIRVRTEDMGNWYTSRRVGESTAMAKTIVENGTDRIVGAHLLGPHADEVINLFALAIRHSLTATVLKHTIYAYPTSASDIAYML